MSDRPGTPASVRVPGLGCLDALDSTFLGAPDRMKGIERFLSVSYLSYEIRSAAHIKKFESISTRLTKVVCHDLVDIESPT